MISVSMDTATTLLRISFLVGAITDALAIIPMIFPRIGSALFGGDITRLGGDFIYDKFNEDDIPLPNRRLELTIALREVVKPRSSAKKLGGLEPYPDEKLIQSRVR